MSRVPASPSAPVSAPANGHQATGKPAPKPRPEPQATKPPLVRLDQYMLDKFGLDSNCERRFVVDGRKLVSQELGPDGEVLTETVIGNGVPEFWSSVQIFGCGAVDGIYIGRRKAVDRLADWQNQHHQLVWNFEAKLEASFRDALHWEDRG